MMVVVMGLDQESILLDTSFIPFPLILQWSCSKTSKCDFIHPVPIPLHWRCTYHYHLYEVNL